MKRQNYIIWGLIGGLAISIFGWKQSNEELEDANQKNRTLQKTLKIEVELSEKKISNLEDNIEDLENKIKNLETITIITSSDGEVNIYNR